MDAIDTSTGRIVAVRGAVIDVAFPSGPLPPIDAAVLVETGGAVPLVAEVQAHLDAVTVRAIALGATGGLARGTKARVPGGPISVPVGDAVLGRLLDVSGRTGDGGDPLPADLPRRPIHAAPPPLEHRVKGSAMFETGIKALDLLTPVAQGGDVRRGGRRQDSAGDGTDPRHDRRI